MAGFEAALVEFANDVNGPSAEKKKAPSAYIGERKLFVEFIRNFRRGREAYYREQLSRNYSLKHYYLEISLGDLARFNEDLYNELLSDPLLYIEIFEMAAKETLEATLPDVNEPVIVPSIQILLMGDISPLPLRGLTSNHVSKLVCVTGIVISSSRVQAKAVRMGIQCKFCKFKTHLNIGSGISTMELPKMCNNPEPPADKGNQCRPNPFVVLPDETDYIDQQIMKLQEAPETIPTGEMPRHIQLLVERNLVSRAVPGTRIVLVGVSALYAAGRSGRNVVDTSVRTPYIKALGIQVDTAGAGRVFTSFTEEEVTEFKSMARRTDIYEHIVSQIAPVIYGHEDIKKALACQLFGGCRKVLPDGMKLRGDINVLLLGDPGTAKSQMLKFVERVAPIGVYTSGKGSSAAGLTASVVRDPQTSEFYLEGGAMVLADGGIVCIDEFDKMRQQDRVAIHEAMEQQTISIAKAGITTILNARSAVVAAANPSFGVYDDSHSAAENLNEFRSTILSRFDTIFLVKDLRDEVRDAKVSRHVVELHMRTSKSQTNTLRKDRAKMINQDGDIQKLKRYIAYCRLHCAPRLTEAASAELANHYVSMRKAYKERERTGEGNAVPITVRQLEAIVRLSESLAKMSLSPYAREDHVAEAIRLFTVSSIEATNSGKVTLERLSDAVRAEIENVETLIKRKLPIDSNIRVKALEAQLVKAFGVSEASIRRAVSVMVQKEELEFRHQRKTIYRRSLRNPPRQPPKFIPNSNRYCTLQFLMSTTKKEAEHSYYPGSKIVYDEPNKAQATGKTAVNKSTVDVSDSTVVAAREAVKDFKNPTNWVWFGYEGKTSNKLKVVAQGEDGLKEMVDETSPNEQLFGLLAYEYKATEVPKLVYITWNPSGVPPQLKGIMHGRTWDVGQFLAPYHVQHEAQSEDDLTVAVISKKVDALVK